MASGRGFAGGYGPIARSAYATPASLGFKPLAAEFLAEGGVLAFPTDLRLNPHHFNPALSWRTEDWDPGLRFWSLPFDPQLTEWLQDVDLSAPATLAAREFAAAHAQWTHAQATLEAQAAALVADDWLADADIDWMQADPDDAWSAINRDLDELQALMQDSRAAYLVEAWAQADDIPAYFAQLLQLDPHARPWTAQLIGCGLAIGNVAYMTFKSRFARVRPSTLCPGLMPQFGPPQHPAFPSGHAFLGHFIALLLLKIPGVAARFGVGIGDDAGPGRAPTWDKYKLDQALDGPLFWLAHRLAVNRERMGLHYPTDSSAGRHLAGGIWNALLDADADNPIPAPTLKRVLARAIAEWD